ncbi:MAG: FkbM family methyltransferase [Phycisphaerae bacterium]
MVFLFGTSDPKVVAVCATLLRPGDVFLDVGANYGTVGLLCHVAVGPRGFVHMFEPQPDLCRGIRASIESYDLRNIQVHEVALLDRSAKLDLLRVTNHSGAASLIHGATTERVEQHGVAVRSVAEYVPPLITGRPLGVKLDVEGAEPYLLPWFAQLPNTRFIAFECAHIARARDLLQACHAAGFRCFGLAKSVLLTRCVYLESASQIGQYHDVVAVRVPAGCAFRRSYHVRQLASIAGG